MISTINISLPQKLKLASDRLVENGEYASFSDLVRTALRLLIQKPTNYDLLATQARREFLQGKSQILKSDKDINHFLKSLP